MSVFGTSPLGTGPGPFGGPGLISVLGVLPTGQNSCLVVFDRAPSRFDTLAFNSGTNPANYTVVGIDPSQITSGGDVFIPAGSIVPTYSPAVIEASADVATPSQVLLRLDAPFEFRARYLVRVDPRVSTPAGDVYAGPVTFTITGLGESRPDTGQDAFAEKYRDFALAIVDGAQEFAFDPNGDIALANARDSLTQRVARRVFSTPGGFAHLPGYGVGVRVKALARAPALGQLAESIAEQVRREPDVIAASASVRIDGLVSGGALVVIHVFVRQRNELVRTLVFTSPVVG